MSDCTDGTPVRELPHIVLTFRCGCRLNVAIGSGRAVVDHANRPCGKHGAVFTEKGCLDVLLPAKLIRLEFHPAHDAGGTPLPPEVDSGA